MGGRRSLYDIRLPFQTDELELLHGAVSTLQPSASENYFYFGRSIKVLPVIKEELLSGSDEFGGKDADPVIPVDHLDPGVAVGIAGMIGETDLVPHSRRIHREICAKPSKSANGATLIHPMVVITVVEVEEEGALLLVVHFPSTVRLILGDDLMGKKILQDRS